MKVTVSEFEQRVIELEEIVIRIRASRYDKVENYDYQRQAAENTSVSDWLLTRILPKVGGKGVSVLNGDLQEPHGRTLLKPLRASYER